MRDPDLWTRLCQHSADSSEDYDLLCEYVRLQQGWARGYCKRVIEEYMRFLYLFCVSDGRIAPPREVDAVWQVHLSFSQAYWDRLCKLSVGRPIHRNPHIDPLANSRFEAQEAARELYAQEFERDPPSKIWYSDRKYLNRANVLNGLIVVIFGFVAVFAGVPVPIVIIASVFLLRFMFLSDVKHLRYGGGRQGGHAYAG